jgi:hypothetical protein
LGANLQTIYHSAFYSSHADDKRWEQELSFSYADDHYKTNMPPRCCFTCSRLLPNDLEGVQQYIALISPGEGSACTDLRTPQGPHPKQEARSNSSDKIAKVLM